MHDDLMLIWAIGLGGAGGAIVRATCQRHLRPWHGIPVSTMTVNLVGSFAAGWIWEARPGAIWGAFLLLGFCGALTTFSTFALETVKLVQAGRRGISLSYLVGTIVMCPLVCLIGRLSASW